MTEITVYTRNNCQPCKMTKNWLTDKALEFTEINIDLQPEYTTELQLYGFRSAPVVAVGSLDNAWAGFRPDSLRELLTEN